jgi:hypothetical protein
MHGNFGGPGRPGAACVGDIPDDFAPKPLGSRSDVLRSLRAALPFADYSDETWVRVDLPDLCMEISVGPDDPVSGIAFHVRNGALARPAIAEILGQLDARAFDPQADSGIFDLNAAASSFARWQQFKLSVVQDPATEANP